MAVEAETDVVCVCVCVCVCVDEVRWLYLSLEGAVQCCYDNHLTRASHLFTELNHIRELQGQVCVCVCVTGRGGETSAYKLPLVNANDIERLCHFLHSHQTIR